MEGTQFGSGKTALVVDDQNDVCLMLAALLESFGFGVVCANDGYQAMEKLSHRKVDVIRRTDRVLPEFLEPRRRRGGSCSLRKGDDFVPL